MNKRFELPKTRVINVTTFNPTKIDQTTKSMIKRVVTTGSLGSFAYDRSVSILMIKDELVYFTPVFSYIFTRYIIYGRQILQTTR